MNRTVDAPESRDTAVRREMEDIAAPMDSADDRAGTGGGSPAPEPERGTDSGTETAASRADADRPESARSRLDSMIDRVDAIIDEYDAETEARAESGHGRGGRGPGRDVGTRGAATRPGRRRSWDGGFTLRRGGVVTAGRGAMGW